MTPPNLTLLKASAGLILVGLLCASSTRVYRKKRTWSSAFQLAGACLLLVGVAIHICKALHLLASKDWGAANSAGHYLDLVGAIAGLTLLSFGLFWRRRSRITNMGHGFRRGASRRTSLAGLSSRRPT